MKTRNLALIAMAGAAVFAAGLARAEATIVSVRKSINKAAEEAAQEKDMPAKAKRLGRLAILSNWFQLAPIAEYDSHAKSSMGLIKADLEGTPDAAKEAFSIITEYIDESSDPKEANQRVAKYFWKKWGKLMKEWQEERHPTAISE